MSKAKGSRAERELFHMFFDAGFIAVRAAGSGSTPLPNPDLIIGGKGRYLAIECKAIKSPYKYFDKKEIEELVLFASCFGAEPWLGLRFDREPWYFVKVEDLERTEKDYFGITLKKAKEKNITFEFLIENKKEEKRN